MSLRTWQIAFRHHELMNPSSPEKIRALGGRLRLRPDTTVLDLGCGTCGPAVLLASEFGCSVTAVDSHEPFLAEGHRRAEAAGVPHLVTLVASDGAEFVEQAHPSDVALCIGATWILGGYAESLAALHRLVPVDGHVAVGEKYRQDGETRPKAPAPLAELVDVMTRSGLAPVSVLTSSSDDWNTYTSLMWLSIEDWLAENPDHPDAARFRQRDRGSDLDEHRDGWAILAGRRTADLNVV